MEREIDKLMSFVSKAVDAGVQAYIRTTEPKKDRIKQNEALRFIARCGHKPSVLKKWENEGLLRAVKTGESRNSAKYYSLAEIKNLIASIELSKIY